MSDAKDAKLYTDRFIYLAVWRSKMRLRNENVSRFIYILDRDHLFINSYYRFLVRVLEYNKVISGISAERDEDIMKKRDIKRDA
jgi:hypothetical protein